MYDLIGDIHGHADELTRLLDALGYQPDGAAYRHPTRKVVFLGDYIDRGPRIRRTLEIVRGMVEGGHAFAILGNHEFNALAYHTAHPEQRGTYLRPHTDKNVHQHAATVAQLDPDELADYLNWFRTIPAWLDLSGVRAVHACWDQDHLALFDAGLREHGGFTTPFLHAASAKGSPLYRTVETILKGKEGKLPSGVSFRDKGGDERTEVRTRWYLDPTGHTYRTYALQTDVIASDVPLTDEIIAAARPYPADAPPVFMGHYWLSADRPEPLAANVACLDYSVAKDGFLCAYRWDGERVLDPAKFVLAPSRPAKTQTASAPERDGDNEQAEDASKTVEVDPRDVAYREELERHNRIAEMYIESDHGTPSHPDDEMTHDVEDVVAHLKALPEERAVAKAREWTGREDISTLAEAEAAVREALDSGREEMEDASKPAEVDPRDAYFEREEERHNRFGDSVREAGHGSPDIGGFNPGPDDAIAHLRVLPETDAVEKAREWTGREDITTLDEAVKAVRSALDPNRGPDPVSGSSLPPGASCEATSAAQRPKRTGVFSRLFDNVPPAVDRLGAEREQFVALIRYWHDGHPRPDQVQHCINVMGWLNQALDREPGQVAARQAMSLAALGHDLYEDTTIDPALVALKFNREVSRLIAAVTERDGVAEFVERVASGPEEARLIKLSDGIDNYDGLVRNNLVQADPAKWVEVVRKQMEPMFSRLAAVPFERYPAAGAWLQTKLGEYREQFWAAVGEILRRVKV